MLTKDQIIEAVKAGRESKDWISSRDYSRLIGFFDSSEWGVFGFNVKDGETPDAPTEFTEAAVREQMARDLDFAFEKALGQRGLSADAMNSVMLMWMWVMEDDLQHDEEYAQYGLPLLKKIAVKYSLPNEIGNDYGNERKYACD